MGAVERSWSDLEADRFFAGFVNATPELIAAVETERGGNLAAVVTEEKAFGYWDRKMAARAQRRAARERAEAVERAARVEASAVTRGPDEGARLAPLAEQSALMLPGARFVLADEEEHIVQAPVLDLRQHRDPELRASPPRPAQRPRTSFSPDSVTPIAA